MTSSETSVDPGPETNGPAPSLLEILQDLRRDVAELELPLEVEGVEEARDSRLAMLGQLDDHLVPRLRELSAPAVVVVAGSTGAGKSTLVNSVLGQEVTKASVLRPTTREPVLVMHPAEAELMADSAIAGLVRPVEHPDVPRGIALLDAPDLDSLLAANRETAERLLEAADLWLFVTTAARYGDRLPWQALERARGRGASVAMVLNRTAAAELGPVRTDLLDRLKQHGMADTPLFIIPDAGPHQGPLDPESVAPVTRWLTTVAGSDRARTVVLRTLRGSVASLTTWLADLVAAARTQAEAAESLESALAGAVPAGQERLRDAVETGALGAGAVDAHWHEVLEEDGSIARLGGSRWRRPGRRVAERRERALAPVLQEVRTAAVGQVEAAARTAADEARRAMTDAGAAGESLAESVAAAPSTAERRAQAAERAVDAWIALAGAEVDALIDDPSGPRGAVTGVRGLGRAGFRTLVLVGACGVTSAQRVVDSLLGTLGSELTDRVRDQLLECAADAVAAELTPYSDRLAHPSLQEEAHVGAQVRLAELKGVLRQGR